jgi:CheY-like chemotaxis protein
MVIEGFKRLLFSQRDQWKPYFAVSGQDALDVLAREHVDIIVSDMRMPDIDGAMLLSKVKKYYPRYCGLCCRATRTRQSL